jgi:hypothetical protein
MGGVGPYPYPSQLAQGVNRQGGECLTKKKPNPGRGPNARRGESRQGCRHTISGQDILSRNRGHDQEHPRSDEHLHDLAKATFLQGAFGTIGLPPGMDRPATVIRFTR